ncbi:glycosyltransferase family 2 protein [Saccharicrinis sp. FJH2]|uniref:glycosyltransferase family 2 protein n=1 Tax=Saccharicrinis sp. FJH65 TaxID=3344659 RepID=UPI0035F2D9AE
MISPLVTIVCITYNHEKYIGQAIEGFLNQKTTFEMEILIHDDASTDNTANIIREFQKKDKRIKVIFQKENQYSIGAKPFLSVLRTGELAKYIAICEGDDYWTDPLKLQKQVDFLEANPEYGMVHTSHAIYSEHEQKFLKRKFDAPEHNDNPTFEDILLKNPVSTLTVLANTSLIRRVVSEFPDNNTWKMGDFPMWLGIAHYSKIKYLPDNTAVYRVLNNSLSNQLDFSKKMAMFNSVFEVKKWFIENYGCSDAVRKKVEVDYYKDKLKLAFVFREPETAFEAKQELLKTKAFNFLDALFVFGSRNRIKQLIVKVYLKLFVQNI